jgi:hypothetical protein
VDIADGVEHRAVFRVAQEDRVEEVRPIVPAGVRPCSQQLRPAEVLRAGVAGYLPSGPSSSGPGEAEPFMTKKIGTVVRLKALFLPFGVMTELTICCVELEMPVAAAGRGVVLLSSMVTMSTELSGFSSCYRSRRRP